MAVFDRLVNSILAGVSPSVASPSQRGASKRDTSPVAAAFEGVDRPAQARSGNADLARQSFDVSD